MACSVCGSSTVVFAVPADYRVFLSDADTSTDADEPSGDRTAAFCTRCLTLEYGDEVDTDGSDAATDFSRVSDAFPTNPEQAIPLALALGLATSLATNRSAIEPLLRDVERAGADPLLVLDRLQRDPSVEPAIDLERRRHQLEQLLY